MLFDKKIIYVIIAGLCIAASISYGVDIDTTKPWHTLQQISLMQGSTESIDNDNNGNVDNVSYSIKSIYLYPSISTSNICTNDFSNTNCDSRYYSYGDKVDNAELFDGHQTTDFCLADKSNCNDMYKLCNETGVCENVYANAVLFNALSGTIQSPSTIKINNTALQEGTINIGWQTCKENQVMSANNFYFSDLENNRHLDLYCNNHSDIPDEIDWFCSGDIDGNIIDVYGNVTTNNLDVTYSLYSNESYYSKSSSNENIENTTYNMRFAVLYNYGDDYADQCPSGWQEVGYGTYRSRPSNDDDMGEITIKARTCIKEAPCVVIYNYGYYNQVNACPSGWNEAGLGAFDPMVYVRTCYKCFGE